ncbi:hypothetical protein PQ610_04720 [Tardisphaera miroshnichenkoae]
MGSFRIDVLKGNEAIEIQLSGAYRLKTKIRALLDMGYIVKLVIPIQAVLETPSGTVYKKQTSKVFRELAGLAGLFPADGLEVLLLYLRERRTWSRVKKGRRYVVPRGKFKRDTIPLEVIKTVSLKKGEDLLKLVAIPSGDFTSFQLSRTNSISPATGSRACYILRHAGVVTVAGKRGRAYVYRLKSPQANSDKS